VIFYNGTNPALGVTIFYMISSFRLYCRMLAGLFLILLFSGCATSPDPVQRQREFYGKENLWMLASKWSKSPDEALFYAMGDKLEKLKVPGWENKQFVAMQHFGTPVSSSMLKEPRFLEYRLIDGRPARLYFGKNGQKFQQSVPALNNRQPIAEKPSDGTAFSRGDASSIVDALLPPVPPPMN